MNLGKSNAASLIDNLPEKFLAWLRWKVSTQTSARQYDLLVSEKALSLFLAPSSFSLCMTPVMVVVTVLVGFMKLWMLIPILTTVVLSHPATHQPAIMSCLLLNHFY